MIRLGGVSSQVQDRSWEADQPLRVGRLATMDIHLADTSLSRLHAEILPAAVGWVVRDLGSTNGTYLNGERLGRVDATLAVGDSLQFGDIVLTVLAIDEHPDSGVPWIAGLRPQYRCQATWDDLVSELLAAASDGPQARDLLAQLAKIGRHYKATDTLESYLNAILWQAAEVLDAVQGVIVLSDERSDKPKVRVAMASTRAGDLLAARYEGLVRTTLAAGESVLLRASTLSGGEAVGSTLCAVLRNAAGIGGALCLTRAPEQPQFTEQDLRVADLLALAASPSILSFLKLQERQEQFALKTLMVLTQLVQMRDDRIGNHGQRVTDYAILLAGQMGLKEEDKDLVRKGAPLHELGKIGIKDAVLNKPDQLTDSEIAHVRERIGLGADLLQQIPSLSALLPIVRNTHERWDGSGYPDGLSGTNIPLLARIVAVADAFDAMTTDQPYRASLTPAQALDEIQQLAGSQFDPDCVAAFVKLRANLEDLVRQRFALTQTISVRDLRQFLRQMGSTRTKS
jgi:hypothetical protein